MRRFTVMAALAALVFTSMAAMDASAEGVPTITSPTAYEHVLSDVLTLSAVGVDDDARWALRKSDKGEDPTCIAQTDVAGNVRGFTDEATIDDGKFLFTISRSAEELEDGAYCFSVNQGISGDGSSERDIVFFYLSQPESKDACKNGGWETNFPPDTYRNQGQCVSFFASGGKSAK